MQNEADEIGIDDMEDEDEVDGDHIDYESTDSMTSNNQLPRDYSMRPKKASRLSSSNAAYYNCRQTISRGSIRQVLSSYKCFYC